MGCLRVFSFIFTFRSVAACCCCCAFLFSKRQCGKHTNRQQRAVAELAKTRKYTYNIYTSSIHLSFVEGFDNPPFNVLHLAEHPYLTNHNVLILDSARKSRLCWPIASIAGHPSKTSLMALSERTHSGYKHCCSESKTTNTLCAYHSKCTKYSKTTI